MSLTIPELSPETTRRFWAKVDQRSDDECWTWTASRTFSGYGAFAVNGNKIHAHRVAYRLATGIDPGDLFVLHSCDNPPCVNPAHLRSGTHLDNMRDMIERDRRMQPDMVGERNSATRLTVDDVRSIRRRHEAGETQAAIARDYELTRGAIGHITRRLTWDHVA